MVLVIITGTFENVLVTTLPLMTTETVPTLEPEQNFCEGTINGTLLPYPYDCNWYIRCEDHGFVIKRCEPGRHFNAILQLCDYPEYAQCVAAAYPTSTEMPTSSTTTEITPTLHPEDSPCVDVTNGTLLPYPYDCDWYIRCEDHSPIVLRCEKEREFNALLQICDYPEFAQCTAAPYPTTTVKPPSTTTEIVPTLIPGEEVCNGKVNGTLLPYQFDCDWYIRCENNASSLHRCRKLRQFNAVLQVCDYPENAKCLATAYPTTPTVTDPTTTPPSSGSNVCCGAENGTLMAYPGDRTQYIECIYPIPVAVKCDRGQYFNSNSQACESIFRMTSRQNNQSMECGDKANGTLLPFSEDCKKYFFCINGEEVLLPCTIGSIFDATVGNCIPGDVCP